MYKKVTMLFSLCSPGVGGVPYFEIYLADKPDLRQQFSGAQPIDTFVAIFNRLSLMAKMWFFFKFFFLLHNTNKQQLWIIWNSIALA